ncbi:LAETG motif-containing sortase-dependent surface protein [Streptomyces sp. NRRL WC-3742]|uniref:LAETG motif-containing sortase-dependent surface protein n=1 Tax=Streptomyces sp. NRRL WC-3742 TaxID=1463934 RepID=UPI0004C9D4DF|nr:LAETG motif-containing sortase-dependent surface protein [Streptomyces sp. NRRL WC-3742]
MKLRRGFAIPTAAVIASAAVIAAAPIASAESPAPTATTGASAAPTATTSASTAASPAATPSASASASASTSATATATATTKPTTSTSPAPTGELTLPKITVKGFPTTVVPGAPAVEFSAEVANVSGHESAVFPYLIVATEHNKITNAQIKLQYQDPDTKAWKDATPDTGTDKARVLDLGDEGFYLNKDEKLTFQLKLAVTADTEADAAASALGAAYIEKGNEKVGFPASAVTPFTIGKAGTNAGGGTPVTVPDAKGKKPSGDAVAKAKSKAGARAGNLAETGGGSNTTAIALTGAAVVALGAGTLVFLRRRKAGASA